MAISRLKQDMTPEEARQRAEEHEFSANYQRVLAAGWWLIGHKMPATLEFLARRSGERLTVCKAAMEQSKTLGLWPKEPKRKPAACRLKPQPVHQRAVEPEKPKRIETVAEHAAACVRDFDRAFGKKPS